MSTIEETMREMREAAEAAQANAVCSQPGNCSFCKERKDLLAVLDHAERLEKALKAVLSLEGRTRGSTSKCPTPNCPIWESGIPADGACSDCVIGAARAALAGEPE